MVDRPRDGRTGQFNPFLLQPRLIDGVPDLLDHHLHTISTATRELPLTQHREVLDLILGRNLRRTCAAMLTGIPPVRPMPNTQKRKQQARRENNWSCHDCCDPFCCCDGATCCDCGCDAVEGCDGPGSCLDCGCGCDSCCDCGDCCVCDCG